MQKKFHYLPKEEFRRRLVNFKEELDYLLSHPLNSCHTLFMPALFGVYSYMWCKSKEDLFKKVPDMTREECLDKLLSNGGFYPVPERGVLLPTACEVVSNMKSIFGENVIINIIIT